VRAAAFVVLAYAPLFAIPSPDVVISFFASAAQVLGLLSVALGGAFFARRSRLGASGALGAKRRPASRWALGIVSALLVAAVIGNVLQHCRSVDEQNRRLRTNLTRVSKEDGKKVRDANLVTLSLSGQYEHPCGLSTEALERKVASGEGLNLIDVREPEEVETGRVAGAWHIRYPDLQLDPSGLVVEGKETVLLCYSGNRSSELVNHFTKLGYDVKFLIGGYEKWISEDRPLAMAPGKRRTELREIPDYPHRDLLLDTPEVERLVREEGAVFVDVRYKAEFDAGHLPGAVNFCIRKMPSDEMWTQIRALERRPLIVPCYDKRGAFFGRILGSRLHRAGHDFRGRYTVPHEFVGAGIVDEEEKGRDYIAAWEAENQATLLGAMAAPLQDLLAWLRGHLGHLALAIAAAVLLLRLVILPLTLKSERDQCVLRSLRGETARLKARWAEDPQALGAALRRLHRRHRLTPLRNFLGSFVQITLFLVFFAAVHRTAKGSTDGLGWIASLGEPDPLAVLPLVLGGLVFLHLELGASKRSAVRSLGRIAASGLLVAITVPLAAALSLYLVVNVLFMALQSRVVAWKLTRRATATPPVLAPRGIVPLRLAHRVPGTGNKAARLGRMLDAGLPVPDGFVVTQCVLGRSAAGSAGAGGMPVLRGGSVDLTRSERREVDRHWRRLGAPEVAVRSSGVNEDGAAKSYAGVFETILHVRREDFFDALEKVRASLGSSRALAYSGIAGEAGAALVEVMVPAEYAGVLFTEHPDQSGSSVVELVEGLGESLVSGAATPSSFRFGRASGRLLEAKQPPVDLRPLVALGRRIEELFGCPQDIEWAYAQGRFFILQARDITATRRLAAAGDASRRAFESERYRVMELLHEAGADEKVLVQNELSELLPRPTPLSLSVMQSLWEAGGSTDLACRELGIPYAVEEESAPCVEAVFGALYVNQREMKRRLGRGPGTLAALRLARSAAVLEDGFRQGFLPAFLRRMETLEALDLGRLSPAQLLARFDDWRREFSAEVYVQAELVNLAADFYLKAAVGELERRGLNAPAHLACPETVVYRALRLLPQVRTGERPVADFLDLMGHRCPQDWELAQPRYAEDPQQVTTLASRSAERNGASRCCEPAALPPGRLLRLAVERAARFQVLKEEAKHHVLRHFTLLRRVLVELDSRLGLEGGIFYLTAAEVARLGESSFLVEARDLIRQRRAERQSFAVVSLPPKLSASDLERLEHEHASTPRASGRSAQLRGLLVAGDGGVQGRARVVASPEEIDSFEDGEILVARFTDPEWTPLFSRAAAVVTEVGGRLSHAAIVAREYNVTAVVGVEGLLDSVETGDVLKLHADGTVERVSERRNADRRCLMIRVVLRRQHRLIEAMLKDISRTGALVVLDGDEGADLALGQEVTVKVVEAGEEFEATVVREDTPGTYGLCFSAPYGELGGPGLN
jgi:phosphoenolpyruvate synthase/pyruvate phosphate dikinase/rhodanese-related sulfurtransferase